ncbi:MAG: hypothetical protein WCK29_01550, partial [archaeon]
LIESVNLVKNFKGVLYSLVWIIGLVILFIVSNIGYAFLPNEMIGKLFLTLYIMMFWITIVGVPIYWIKLFLKAVQSKEVQRMIDRGVDVQSY